jgi:hypothetical protein
MADHPDNYFEIVETRPPEAPVPGPEVVFNNLLWRKKEALEIMQSNAAILRDCGMKKDITLNVAEILEGLEPVG